MKETVAPAGLRTDGKQSSWGEGKCLCGTEVGHEAPSLLPALKPCAAIAELLAVLGRKLKAAVGDLVLPASQFRGQGWQESHTRRTCKRWVQAPQGQQRKTSLVMDSDQNRSKFEGCFSFFFFFPEDVLESQSSTVIHTQKQWRKRKKQKEKERKDKKNEENPDIWYNYSTTV